ncbi:LINE-1 reverse transcriptase like [Trifolium medium]|uniref:LINE-1 reverse transcriptase like n=1 Tax=Trifolium medium TaxID=97028 RepID=A0A392LZ60_9FABA|nr:LINE-1 reverse transcriptase like [Trifolium medium]
MVGWLKVQFTDLIPKVEVPQKLSDYRHISLVGCIYKVLAKVLDGILIANEFVDEAKSKKKILLMFKVDFEKAYDSMEWSYLLYVMHKMNFPSKWRRWIS